MGINHVGPSLFLGRAGSLVFELLMATRRGYLLDNSESILEDYCMEEV